MTIEYKDIENAEWLSVKHIIIVRFFLILFFLLIFFPPPEFVPLPKLGVVIFVFIITAAALKGPIVWYVILYKGKKIKYDNSNIYVINNKEILKIPYKDIDSLIEVYFNTTYKIRLKNQKEYYFTLRIDDIISNATEFIEEKSFRIKEVEKLILLASIK